MNCDCIPSRKCRGGFEVQGRGGKVKKNREGVGRGKGEDDEQDSVIAR